MDGAAPGGGVGGYGRREHGRSRSGGGERETGGDMEGACCGQQNGEHLQL